MTKWHAWASGLPAIGVAAIALSACSGELQTYFGPPGGLSGKELPPGLPEPDEAGRPDGAMKKCTFKTPADAGMPDSATTETGTTDGESTEEGGTDAGTMPDAGEGADGSAPDADSMGCKVSWSNDIFPNMRAAGAWQCASASCHGSGVQSPMMSDDPTASYDSLAAFKLPTAPFLPFLLPCSTDPKKSAFVCNTTTTSCGVQMPLTTNGATSLTKKQVSMIETWIACGAIDN